jgi:hypothetical protein
MPVAPVADEVLPRRPSTTMKVVVYPGLNNMTPYLWGAVLRPGFCRQECRYGVVDLAGNGMGFPGLIQAGHRGLSRIAEFPCKGRERPCRHEHLGQHRFDSFACLGKVVKFMRLAKRAVVVAFSAAC